MTWHILGAGSLGCLWAARLARAGFACELILRNRQRLHEYLAQGGQIGYRAAAPEQSYVVPVAAGLTSDVQEIHCLLLCCKAHDAVAAITAIKSRLASGSQVFLLQNGMGSQQEIARLLPQCRVVPGSSTEGAYLEQPFQVVHAGVGSTLLGDFAGSNEQPAVLADWHQAAINWQWSGDIAAALWRKLALNCMINPLTVVHGCKNGDLLSFSAKLQQLADELSQLLSAAGYPLTGETLYGQGRQVIQATATNISSMLQDVQAGRRTEISHITGYALAQAQRHRLALPVLHQLHQQLREQLATLGLPTD